MAYRGVEAGSCVSTCDSIGAKATAHNYFVFVLCITLMTVMSDPLCHSHQSSLLHLSEQTRFAT